MPKLWGKIAALGIAGVDIPRGADGSFDVPAESVAEVKQAFGLRDTAEEADAAKPDVPAEVHDAAIDEAQKQIDALKGQVDALTIERDALAAQLADAKVKKK